MTETPDLAAIQARAVELATVSAISYGEALRALLDAAGYVSPERHRDVTARAEAAEAAVGQFRNWLRSTPALDITTRTQVLDVLDDCLAHFDITPEQVRDAILRRAALSAAPSGEQR